MTVKFYNLARMTTLTRGTGTVTLVKAVAPFLTFAGAGVQDGDTVRYSIIDGIAASEVGSGVYTAATKTLTRNAVLTSTNNNNPINLSGAGAQVFITIAAEDVTSQSILSDNNIWTGTNTFTKGIDLIFTADPNVHLGLTGIENFIGSGTPFAFNYIDINDFYDAGATISPGFLIQHAIGNLTGGGRIASQSVLRVAATPIAGPSGSAFNQYVSQTPQIVATAPGPVGNFSAIYAQNPYAELQTGATGWSQVVGAEFDIGIQTGAAAVAKNAITITLLELDREQGLVTDAAIQFYKGPLSPGWRDLFLIGYEGLDDDYPSDPTGTIMRTINGAQGIGLDFWTTDFTTASLRLPGFETDPDGNVTVGITSTGHTTSGFVRVTDGTNTGALYLDTGGGVVNIGATTNTPVQFMLNNDVKGVLGVPGMVWSVPLTATNQLITGGSYQSTGQFLCTFSPWGNNPDAPEKQTLGGFNIIGTASDAPNLDRRVFFGSVSLLSDTGAAATDGFRGSRVAFYTGVDARTGTGNVWTQNLVAFATPDSGDYVIQGIELDIDNAAANRYFVGSSPTGFPNPYAIGLNVSGSSSSVVNWPENTPSTRPLYYNSAGYALSGGHFDIGFAMFGDVRSKGLYINNAAAYGIHIGGTHTTYALYVEDTHASRFEGPLTVNNNDFYVQNNAGTAIIHLDKGGAVIEMTNNGSNYISASNTGGSATLNLGAGSQTAGQISIATSGNVTYTGDQIFTAGKVIRWGADTGVSRDSAAVFDFGNGTQGSKTGTINATTINALTGFQVNGSAFAFANIADYAYSTTFQPVLTSAGGGVPTYGSQVATVTKIGKQVLINGYIELTNLNTLAAGLLTITGLPYTSANVAGNYGAVALTAWGGLGTSVIHLSGDLSPNSAAIRLYITTAATTNNGTTQLNQTDLTNTFYVAFSAIYRTT